MGCRQVPIIVRPDGVDHVAHGHADTENPHPVSPERGVHNGHVSHQILHPI
jgi:hypothetical protein